MARVTGTLPRESQGVSTVRQPKNLGKAAASVRECRHPKEEPRPSGV